MLSVKRVLLICLSIINFLQASQSYGLGHGDNSLDQCAWYLGRTDRIHTPEVFLYGMAIEKVVGYRVLSVSGDHQPSMEIARAMADLVKVLPLNEWSLYESKILSSRPDELGRLIQKFFSYRPEVGWLPNWDVLNSEEKIIEILRLFILSGI